MNDISILGMGLHTALGFGAEEHFSALNNSPRIAAAVNVHYADQRSAVPCHTLANFPLVDDDPAAQEKRLYEVIRSTVENALSASSLNEQQRRHTAVFIGSSSFDISVSEARYRRELQGQQKALPLAASSSIGNLAFYIAERFSLRGPDYSFNTACTASANALMYAAQMIEAGLIEHAVIVGVELANATTLMGFHSLGLLTDKLMTPFDDRRAGLAIGEACAAVVIGRATDARALHFLGGTNLCDTHSISAANPDGSSIARVMQQALADAKLAASSITAIKTHGTASLLNDEAEAAGLRQTFAQLPLLCALKPYIGHTLGACGLSEMVLLCTALQRGYFPATPGVCVDPGELGIAFPQTLTPIEPGNFMLNYFGFGGSNTSLIISNENR